HFPDLSLLVIGGIAIAASFLSLDTVISALMTTRILVQFLGQVLAIYLLRKHFPGAKRPYKMLLYPLPALLALAGWIFVFATSGWFMLWGTLTLAAGIAFYFIFMQRREG